MADAVAIVRNANGKITMSQYNKIIKNIASPKLSFNYKRRLIQWIGPQPIIVNPSPTYSAFIAAEANIAIW